MYWVIVIVPRLFSMVYSIDQFAMMLNMFFAAETGANSDVESILVTREASHTKHRQHAPSPAKVVPPLSTGKCPLFSCLESQCLIVPLHLNLKNSQMALLVGTVIPEQRRTNFMFFATIKI